MTPRTRIVAIVALAAGAAAAAVIGITLSTRQTPAQPKAIGRPPLTALVPAPPAVRAAYRDWPGGTLKTMTRLARERPRSAPVQFYAGLAFLSGGYPGEAETALRRAKRAGRDTWTEVLADSLLHPQYFRRDPPFQPVRPNPLLERGVQLQARGHRHAAERLFLQAARKDPADDEAQVAAAVGRFDKADLAASFSRLGPLTRRFPRSQSVRFHLGLLLAWTGQRDAALAQFRRAAALDPRSQLGREANAFVARLGKR